MNGLCFKGNILNIHITLKSHTGEKFIVAIVLISTFSQWATFLVQRRHFFFFHLELIITSTFPLSIIMRRRSQEYMPIIGKSFYSNNSRVIP